MRRADHVWTFYNTDLAAFSSRNYAKRTLFFILQDLQDYLSRTQCVTGKSDRLRLCRDSEVTVKSCAMVRTFAAAHGRWSLFACDRHI